MSSMDKLKTLNAPAEVAVNFLLVVTSFDSDKQHIVGYNFNDPDKTEFNVRFNNKTHNTSQRPDFSTLIGRQKLKADNVVFIQGAVSVNEGYVCSWMNIMSRDYKKCYTGISPALIHDKSVDTKNTVRQRVSFLDIDNTCVLQKARDLKKAVLSLAKSSSQKNKLKSQGFLVSCVDDTDLLAWSFSFFSVDSVDSAIDDLMENDMFAKTYNMVESILSVEADDIKINLIPVNNKFISNVRISKHDNITSYYQYKGRKYWRDSLYLFEKVFSPVHKKHFWSLQLVSPISRNCPFMPFGIYDDPNNILA